MENLDKTVMNGFIMWLNLKCWWANVNDDSVGINGMNVIGNCT